MKIFKMAAGKEEPLFYSGNETSTRPTTSTAQFVKFHNITERKI
jgi:hypothetical protein